MDAYEYDTWDLHAADTDDYEVAPPDPAVAAAIMTAAALAIAAALFLASPLPARLHGAVLRQRPPVTVPAGRAVWG